MCMHSADAAQKPSTTGFACVTACAELQRFGDGVLAWHGLPDVQDMQHATMEDNSAREQLTCEQAYAQRPDSAQSNCDAPETQQTTLERHSTRYHLAVLHNAQQTFIYQCLLCVAATAASAVMQVPLLLLLQMTPSRVVCSKPHHPQLAVHGASVTLNQPT